MGIHALVQADADAYDDDKLTYLFLADSTTMGDYDSLLFTPWRFDAALLISGIVTMAAIIYLLILLRAGKFNPRTLAFAAVFYLAFAAALVPVLS
ncbi:hypothetical protein JNW88_02415 [Micromonospora sp. ATA32]|nr:hypothetical protein [Micromonospora sp. ATA32]